MRVVDKRGVLCSLVLLAFLAFFFWTQSRLPALDGKAQMGQRNSISSLAFDVVYPLSAEQSRVERIVNSSINWAYTNWQGMTFGFLLAAAVLTLFSYFSFQLNSGARNSQFKQAAIGGVLGTPLGVCANCSTPISFGLYRTGLPVPTALAMLSSSPSFNIIVMTMALSLLPLELVIIKSLFVLFYILLVIPFFSRLFSVRAKVEPVSESVCDLPEEKGLVSFVSAFWRGYFRNLALVLKSTLPFMLLAGALAAVVAEFVSLDALSGDWELWILALVGLCAAFFPVPIAFDVVISVALLAAGVDVAYVAAMFFALGVFSIYPAMMIAKDISFRLSVALFLSVVALSVAAGVIASQYSDYDQQNRAKAIVNELSGLDQLSYLPAELAKPLMRQAARSCHALGKPQQYACFEKFVEQQLSSQFPQDSCQYLEDAVVYREICNEGYRYQQVIRQAEALRDESLCATLTSSSARRCQYDYFFKKSSIEQSLRPCLNLNNEDDQEHCLSNSLALNTELYPSQNICHTLANDVSSAMYFEQCQSAVERVKQELALIQQGDLTLCLELGGQEAVRSCQVSLLNQAFEKGARKSACENLLDSQMKIACADFYHYFESLRLKDESNCRLVAQEALAFKCREDAILASLEKELADIRFRFLSSSSDMGRLVEAEEKQISSSVSRGHVSDTLLLVNQQIVQSDQGREFKLNKYELKDQEAQSEGFIKMLGQSIGLQFAPPMKGIELFEPFSYGRGIAAGDINKDLWPDLAVAHARGVSVYGNFSGQFSKVTELLFGLDLSPVLVSFVDLDSDGQLDLFVSFYSGENRIYWNYSGGFDAKRYQDLKLDNSQLVMSAAFRDVDHDGDIDFAVGSWFAGDLRHFNPYLAQNYYVENRPATGIEPDSNQRREFRVKALPGVQGETLSMLFSDVEGDGSTELFVGNDMDAPDIIYRSESGRFQLAELDGRLPAFSAFNTMSIASGDLNNDTRTDYFSVDMSFDDSAGQEYCRQIGVQQEQDCVALKRLDSAVKNGETAYCQNLAEQDDRKACLEASLIQLAKQARSPFFCNELSGHQVAKELCLAASISIPAKSGFKYADYPQGLQRNVLSLSSGRLWEEVAVEWGVDKSHWSWHSKIADFNNDGWKDIYIGNGYMFGDTGRRVHSNVFFLNDKGKRMTRAETKFGLEDYLNTPSFVTLDFDRDGDLDIISQRVAADYGVFVNQSKRKGLSLELLKHGQAVLGASLTLEGDTIASSELSQTSELVLGGGFLSFDELVAHFAGVSEELNLLKISWPDGFSEQINYPFSAGYYYQLSLDQ